MKSPNVLEAESSITLLEENEQLLREHAQRIVADINRVLGDKRAVEAANANDTEILAGKQLEIDRLDAAVDPNDLDALQNLVARRDQLSRLTVKYDADAKERLATADANIAALDLTNELMALIQEARLVAIGQITTAMRPFFSNDALLAQFLPRTETMLLITRHMGYTPGHVDTVTEIENAVRDLIEPIVNGTPPWLFTREPMAQ